MKRRMDCFQANRMGCWLTLAAFAVLPVCLLLRRAGIGSPRALGIIVFGWLLVLAICAVYVWQTWCVCPGCGAPLKHRGRMLAKLPKYCPACGEKLEESSRL